MEEDVIEFNYRNLRRKVEDRWISSDDDDFIYIPRRKASPGAIDYSLMSDTIPDIRSAPTIRWEDYEVSFKSGGSYEIIKKQEPKPKKKVSFWKRILNPFKTFE